MNEIRIMLKAKKIVADIKIMVKAKSKLVVAPKYFIVVLLK